LAPRYFVSTDVYDDDAELALDAADVALDEAAVADVDAALADEAALVAFVAAFWIAAIFAAAVVMFAEMGPSAARSDVCKASNPI